MKLEYKIYASIGLTVFLTIAYYYAYSFVDLYVSKLCDKYVCFEFPPYADFLAIWAAIIGLYFVVTSLDAWKHQDQYQTAKENIKLLHQIAEKLKIYNIKLSNLNERYIMLDYSSDTREFKNTDLYLKYKHWLEKNGIKKFIKDADQKITQQELNLFQEKFNQVISLCHSYVNNIDNRIKQKDRDILEAYYKKEEKIKEVKEKKLSTINNFEDSNNNSNILKIINIGAAMKNKEYPNMLQNDIDRIISQENNTYLKFKKELKLLQDELNNYIE